MAVDKLRQVFETLEHLQQVQKKITASLIKMEKSEEKLAEDTKSLLKAARNVETIDFLVREVCASHFHAQWSLESSYDL